MRKWACALLKGCWSWIKKTFFWPPLPAPPSAMESFFKERGKGIAGAMYALASAAGVFAGLNSGRSRVIALIVMALLLGYAYLVDCAHGRQVRRDQETREAWIAKATEEHQADLKVLLRDQIRAVLLKVAAAVACSDPTERQTLARVARHAALSAAVSMVGRVAKDGTRANLFVLNHTGRGPTMKLETSGFAGRGEESDRVFTTESETLQKTLMGKARFVEKTSDPSLAYETYMTHPVMLNRDRIHGVLTVDCLRTGDLSKTVDGPPMSVLATLIAITYECELVQMAPTATPGGATVQLQDEDIWAFGR